MMMTPRNEQCKEPKIVGSMGVIALIDGGDTNLADLENGQITRFATV